MVRLPITSPTTLRSLQVGFPRSISEYFQYEYLTHSMQVKCFPHLYPLDIITPIICYLVKKTKCESPLDVSFQTKRTKIPDDYVLAPNIFSIIIAIFFLHAKMCISSHLPIRKSHITVMLADHSIIMSESSILNLLHVIFPSPDIWRRPLDSCNIYVLVFQSFLLSLS